VKTEPGSASTSFLSPPSSNVLPNLNVAKQMQNAASRTPDDKHVPATGRPGNLPHNAAAKPKGNQKAAPTPDLKSLIVPNNAAYIAQEASFPAKKEEIAKEEEEQDEESGEEEKDADRDAGVAEPEKPVRLSTSSPSYQGCYKDRKDPVRDLPRRVTQNWNTPEHCVTKCKENGYKFAGVQYNYLCMCGNGFGRYEKVLDADCNSLCEGDPSRHCGGYWKNSIYSVDGEKHDAREFNFDQIDAEECKRSGLSCPKDASQKAIQQSPYALPAFQQAAQRRDSAVHAQVNSHVATNLLKAAQASLRVARQLLPDADNRVDENDDNRVQFGKQKRDLGDDEYVRQRRHANEFLSDAERIMKHRRFGQEKTTKEKMKRSLNEDSDPYDPEDGKDLLVAYLGNMAAYRRQVRSIDDDEDDEIDGANDKKFVYKREVMPGQTDGQFVERFEDESIALKKRKRDAEKKKRQSEESVVEKRSIDDSLKDLMQDNTSPVDELERKRRSGNDADAESNEDDDQEEEDEDTDESGESREEGSAADEEP
jgi:hypothetical protein